jgi:hypothetical protein
VGKAYQTKREAGAAVKAPSPADEAPAKKAAASGSMAPLHPKDELSASELQEMLRGGHGAHLADVRRPVTGLIVKVFYVGDLHKDAPSEESEKGGTSLYTLKASKNAGRRKFAIDAGSRVHLHTLQDVGSVGANPLILEAKATFDQGILIDQFQRAVVMLADRHMQSGFLAAGKTAIDWEQEDCRIWFEQSPMRSRPRTGWIFE